MRKLFALFALVVLTAACGSNGPTGSTDDPIGGNINQGMTPQVLDGITRQPIASGTIKVNGTSASVANGQGSTLIVPGTLVEITGTGPYLDRVASMPSDGVFLLWPTKATSVDYINALVYNEFVPGRRLSRLMQSVKVVPPDAISNDQIAMDNIRDAIQAMNEALSRVPGNPVRYSLESGSVICNIQIDPATLGTNLGRTRYVFSGNEITGLTMLVQSVDAARTNVVHHEFGHELGLGHSISTDDLMHTGRVNGRRFRFNSTELDTLYMMYSRKPGNSAPDRE